MSMLLVNMKRYSEVLSYKDSLGLAKAAEEVYREQGIMVAVAPPVENLGLAREVSVPVFAQYIDFSGMTADKAASLGVKGTMINHSDHRLIEGEILRLVNDARKAGIRSVLCVRDVQEAEAYSVFGPDYMAIEPEELIGTGRSVSRARPEAISQLADLLRSRGAETEPMCGAGITTEQDVRAAIDCGASGGVLVSSAVVKSPDWKRKLEELAAGFRL